MDIARYRGGFPERSVDLLPVDFLRIYACGKRCRKDCGQQRKYAPQRSSRKEGARCVDNN
jgi:hypothetical protein